MIALSPRIRLYPVGTRPVPVAPPRLDLAYLPHDPAFGDGSHPTTRLCAGATDLLCVQNHYRSVLDVGTGTGILARIARARGALDILATDIDPDALRSAHRHADLDAHSVAIRISSDAPDSEGPRFEFAIANILEGPLRDLALPLSRSLVPHGTLLLSGFTRAQTPALRVTYERAGFHLVQEAYLGEWALQHYRTVN